jgi:hypothetical protein
MSLIAFQNFCSVIINNEEAAYAVKKEYFPLTNRRGYMKMADAVEIVTVWKFHIFQQITVIFAELATPIMLLKSTFM